MITKTLAYKNKLCSRSELINKIYDTLKQDLEELRTICKDSIVMCEADGTCYLRDEDIMKKINKMIKECDL